jgi:putative membrane protein
MVMAESEEREKKAGPSDYLAAERTFLAWIRTGVALMGFGFVVARFGLFLQALRAGTTQIAAPSSGLSLAFGTALIFMGVVVNVVAAWNHVRLVHGLNRSVEYNRPSAAAIGVAVALAVIGLALAVYLIFYQGGRGI